MAAIFETRPTAQSDFETSLKAVEGLEQEARDFRTSRPDFIFLDEQRVSVPGWPQPIKKIPMLKVDNNLVDWLLYLEGLKKAGNITEEFKIQEANRTIVGLNFIGLPYRKTDYRESSLAYFRNSFGRVVAVHAGGFNVTSEGMFVPYSVKDRQISFVGFDRGFLLKNDLVLGMQYRGAGIPVSFSPVGI